MNFYTFISQLESGRGRIPPDRYKVWADALNVDPQAADLGDELCGKGGKPDPCRPMCSGERERCADQHHRQSIEYRQRLAGTRVRVIEDRRGFDGGLPINRQQIIAEARGAVALGPSHRLHYGGRLLGKACAQQFDDLDVEAVQPDHRLLCIVAMIVPRPGGCDDEIARLHRRALAIDRGVGAVTLNDEAQRRLRVAMSRRDFAG